MLSGSSLFILTQRSHDLNGMSTTVLAAPAVTSEVLATLSATAFVIVPILRMRVGLSRPVFP